MSEFAKRFQAPTSGDIGWAKFHPALGAVDVHLDGQDGSVLVPIEKVEGLAEPLAAAMEALRKHVEGSAGGPIALAKPDAVATGVIHRFHPLATASGSVLLVIQFILPAPFL
jgi:hypothetical protein